MSAGSVSIPVRTSAYSAASEAGTRRVPVEAPVAIEINGVAYAVMMATPCDLEDFITGFLLSEGLAEAGELGEIALHPLEGGEGYVARVNLPAHRAEPVLERARRRLGDSSCGICGIESIELALRALPPVQACPRARPEAIGQALKAARALQVLGAETAATHAAAFARNDGTIVVLREDVGRHNALDKLIGARSRRTELTAGCLLLSSRASYEMLYKAAQAGIEIVVSLSAPTALAVRLAEQAGQTLLRWHPRHGVALYSHPQRVIQG